MLTVGCYEQLLRQVEHVEGDLSQIYCFFWPYKLQQGQFTFSEHGVPGGWRGELGADIGNGFADFLRNNIHFGQLGDARVDSVL